MRYDRSFTMALASFFMAFFLLSCGGGSDKQKEGDDKEEKDKKEEKSSASKKADKKEKEEISAAKFANLVRKRIVEQAKKNGGYLEFEDPRKGDSVKVELQKVVEKSVRKSAKNVRLVCGKFKGVDDGKDYDIDFFMEGNEPSSLKPAREPLFHKIDGNPEHTYVKNEDGFLEPKKVAEENIDEKKKAEMDS